MKRITIDPATNGWKVRVGCGEVLFVDRKLMLAELERYLLSPQKVEKEYEEKALYQVYPTTAPILGGSIPSYKELKPTE